MKYLFFVLMFAVAEGAFCQGENLFEVDVLPFCSAKYDEYNYVPAKRGAFLLSNHPQRGIKEVKDAQNNYLFNIYYQHNLKSRNTSVNDIGIKNKYHVGSFCLNDNMDYLIFTSQKSEDDLSFGLFYAQKEGRNWSKPKPVFSDFPNVNLLDPFLTVTGDTLLFVANFHNGSGGTDVYMAIGKLGNWTKIERLGNNVNTAFNERYPKLFNQKLFFSSTRSMGYGGMDIYSVDLSVDGFLTPPFHYPLPINSSADDFAYYSIDKRNAYFSSNRNGQDDIFVVKMIIPEFECFPYEEPTRCFEFVEEGTSLIDETMYELEWAFSDGAKYFGLKVEHCFADTGEYSIQLNLIDKASQEVYSNVAKYDVKVENPDQVEILIPEKILKGTAVLIQTPFLKTEETVSYFWDFGDGAIGYGKDVYHTYEKAGQYQISLGQIIKSADGQEEKKCTTKLIEVID